MKGREERSPSDRYRLLASGFNRFCWIEILPNQDGTLLAVEGSYWGCPPEVILVDFGDPMQPPWPELYRGNEFKGWRTEGSCRIRQTFNVVKFPGHPLHGKTEDACSEDEVESLPPSCWREEHVDEIWSRLQVTALPLSTTSEQTDLLSEVVEAEEVRRPPPGVPASEAEADLPSNQDLGENRS